MLACYLTLFVFQTSRLLAIHTNAFIALSVGDFVSSSATFTCTTAPVPSTEWMLPSYDDSSWGRPYDYQSYTAGGGLSSQAIVLKDTFSSTAPMHCRAWLPAVNQGQFTLSVLMLLA